MMSRKRKASLESTPTKAPTLTTSKGSSKSRKQPLEDPSSNNFIQSKKPSKKTVLENKPTKVSTFSTSKGSSKLSKQLLPHPSSASSATSTHSSKSKNTSKPQLRSSSKSSSSKHDASSPSSSKKSNYSHLSKEEQILVVGFTSPPKKKKSSVAPAARQDSNNILQKIDRKGSSSTECSSAVSATTSTALLFDKSILSRSPTFDKSSISNSSVMPSASSSSTSDCSLLMEVKKGNKKVFINPFSPSSPSPTFRSSSDSVIIIEDSPNPQPAKNASPVCTSTPRPSIGAPAFNIFPSPITSNDKTFQTSAASLSQSQESFAFANTSSDGSTDVTVVNRSIAGNRAQNCQNDQDDVIYIEDSDLHINSTIREEEDMEVDDEVAIITLNDARENTVLLESETVGILTETVAQKNTIVEGSPKSDTPGSTVLVIDTNVFISALNSITDLLKHPLYLSGQLFILLPWAVLQELDYLKQHHKNIRIRCMAAVRFINEQLQAGNKQLISQSPQQATERLIPIESNDDKIIICCLQRQKTSEKDRVILVTRDINLSSKALVSGIESADNATLWTKLIKESESTVKEGEGSLPTQVQSGKSANLITGQSSKRSVQMPTTKPQPLPSMTHIQSQQPPIISTRNVIVREPVQTTLSTRFSIENVHRKLSYIWDLISFVWTDVNYECPPNDALRILVRNVFHQTDILHKQLERCISISPIHLWNNSVYFQGLCYTLNHFTQGYNVPFPDITGFISSEDIIRYFLNVNNRPRLYSGFQMIGEMLQDFKAATHFVML